jgi:hypothetical protein
MRGILGPPSLFISSQQPLRQQPAIEKTFRQIARRQAIPRVATRAWCCTSAVPQSTSSHGTNNLGRVDTRTRTPTAQIRPKPGLDWVQIGAPPTADRTRLKQHKHRRAPSDSRSKSSISTAVGPTSPSRSSCRPSPWGRRPSVQYQRDLQSFALDQQPVLHNQMAAAVQHAGTMKKGIKS